MKLFYDASRAVEWLEAVLECGTDEAAEAFSTLYDLDVFGRGDSGCLCRWTADQVREWHEREEEALA